jgi:hypothetical protein
MPPPEITSLTHWSSYEMAKYLKRHEGISVSHNFIHELWQENGLRPHLQGTFKLSKDPDFSAKASGFAVRPAGSQARVVARQFRRSPLRPHLVLQRRAVMMSGVAA